MDNDGVEMDIVVTETSQELNFLITELNGRLAGLGENQFDMVAQQIIYYSWIQKEPGGGIYIL